MYMPKGIQREERQNISELWTAATSTSENPPEEGSNTSVAEPPVEEGKNNVDAPEASGEQPETPEKGSEVNEAAEVTLSDEDLTKISNDVKMKHPDATGDKLTELVEAEKGKRIQDIKIENDLQKRYDDKFTELKALPENANLSDEKILEIAKDKINDDIANSNPWDSVSEKVASSEEAAEFKWDEIGKHINIDGSVLEITENSPQALNEAINQKIQEVRNESEEYAALDDEARGLAKFVSKNGLGGLENYLNPDRNVQRLMALDSDQKVGMYLKQGYGSAEISEEDIKEEIADMKTNMVDDGNGGKISEYDHTLKSLNHNLKAEFRKAQQLVIQRAEQAEAKKAQAQEDQNKVFVGKMQESIDAKKEFMGLDIPDKIKNYVKTNVTTTELNRLKNDPNFLLDAYLFKNFGKDLVNAVREDSFKLGRNKVQPMSPSKPVSDSKNRVTPQTAPKGAGAGTNELASGWQNSLDNLTQ